MIEFSRIHTGALSVTVIVEGNGIGDLTSKPGWGCLRFTLHHCPWGKHLFYPQLWGNQLSRLCSFVFVRQGKLWIQTSFTPFKDWPSVTFCSWRKSWVNWYIQETDNVWKTGRRRQQSFSYYTFRPIWPYLIVEVLATQAKFLQPFDHSAVINSTFAFHITNSWFRGFIAQFNLVKYYFPNLDYISHSSVMVRVFHLAGSWKRPLILDTN